MPLPSHIGSRGAPPPGCCRAWKYVDAAIVIAWVVHLLIVYPPLLAQAPNRDGPFTDIDQQFNRFASASFLAALFGLGWAGFFWRLVSDTSTTSKALLMMQMASGFLFVLHGILLVVNGVWLIGILLLVLALGDAVWMRRARDRIAFLVEVLRLVEALVNSRLRQIAVVAIALSAVQFLFSLVWLAAAITALSLPTTGGVVTTMLILLLSFRWTTGMFKHCLTHVVAVQVTHALKITAESTLAAGGDAMASRPRLHSLTQRAGTVEDAALDSALDRMEGQAPAQAEAAAASGPVGDFAPPRDPLLVASEAQTPRPMSTLWHTLCSFNVAALSSGALLGFASPLAWGFRRAARAAAKKVAGRQALARTMALGAVMPAIFARRTAASSAAAAGPGPSPVTGSAGAGAGVGPAFPGGDLSSPSKAAEVASTPKRGGGGGRSTVINSSSSVNSIFDDDGDDGEEEEDDYRAPRVGAELLVSTTPAGAPGGAGAIGGGAAGAVVSAGTPGAAPRGGSRARTNWRTVFRSLCAWACGRAALKAYSFTDYYLKSTHKYAHVLVATQDRPWCDAAGATWHSFETSAVDGLIDDDVTDRALLFGGYVGGAMLSLLLGTTINTADLSTWLWNALIVFLLGFVGVTLPLTVLEASVSAIFVSFSQVPEVLAAVHPIVFHRFERLSEVYAYSRGKIVSAAIGRGRGRELEGVFGDD